MKRLVRKWRSLPAGSRWALAGLAIAAIAAVTVYLAEESTEFIRMPYRFDVVAPGKLYRSGQPDAQALRNVCRKYKIQTILLLRDEQYPEQEDEYRVAERRGVKIVRVGISSTKRLPDDMLAEICRVFRDKSCYPILAHCEHGVARTGVAVALWRIEQEGWPGDRAVQEMIEHGFPVRSQSGEMRERLRAWGAPKPTASSISVTDNEFTVRSSSGVSVTDN